MGGGDHDDAAVIEEGTTKVGAASGGDPTLTAASDATRSSQVSQRGPDTALIGGRYRLDQLLGEGGMGRVYRAFDLQLRCPVAVKLLHPGPTARADLLLREARAQARVRHDHVAKVVEVGESDGTLFVAMQLVEGPTLREAADTLALEHKVEIVRQAAEAVHAAHGEGLVHRDLKPGNIIIERRDGGAWKAYVVDFGLVRDLEATVVHAETQVAGTPYFMAPEQIRGDARSIDWRTDVYALGATLFSVLTGQPPFPGTSAAVTMFRTLDEPASFPKGSASLPRDLRAIVLRCLEKEPRDRYGSARDLAEDLARFQRGEAVTARPVAAPVRLLRQARRWPRLSAAVLVAVAAVAVLSTLWLRAAMRQRQVAEVSRHFGEEVAAMESVGRLAACQPLHDVARERALIRARMEALAAEVEGLGRFAAGPGHLALGRGWLALGDAVAARRELEAAEAAGYRTAEVAAALGEALVRQYQEAVDEARRIPNKAQREARLTTLDGELRQPAVAALARGRTATSTSAGWVDGQLHLLEQRWDEALTNARAAWSPTPWLYETWRLEGDIWREQAEAAARTGERDEALRLLGLAGEAYAAGIDAARSDLALREAECLRRGRVLAVDDQVSMDVVERAEWAVAACRDALVASPTSVAAHTAVAAVCRQVGHAEQSEGADPRPVLARAVAAAQQALAIDPRSRLALTEVGLSLKHEGGWEALHGIDPRPTLSAAIDALEQAVAVDPGHAAAHSNAAGVYDDLAEWESEHGEDPRASVAAAYRHHEEALALSPDDAAGHHNLAVSYLRRAEAPERWGLDPDDDSLKRAATHFRTAIALRPSLYQSHNGLGSVMRRQAERAAETQQDPRALIDQAIEEFGAALAIRPDFTYALFNRSIAYRRRARTAMDAGGDPLPDLLASRRDLERARELAPDDPDLSSGLAATLALLAEVEVMRGGDASEVLAAALAASEQTLRRNPGNAFAWTTRGEILFQRAVATNRRSGGDGEADLALALEAAAAACRVDPELADAWALEGNVWLARAKWSEQGQAANAGRAVAAYRRACAVTPRALAVVADDLAAAEALAGRSGSAAGSG